MLWRPAYKPRVLRGTSLPSPVEGPFVGAFDLRAQSELGIWLRLFDEAEISAPILLTQPEWTAAQRRMGSAVFPPSRQGQVVWNEDPSGHWADLVQPDRPERSFAGIGVDGTASIFVIGPPTEEVWEEFLERLPR